LIVVAELNRNINVTGVFVGGDLIQDFFPVTAGSERDCCCATVAVVET
jgi:hypothetical protein